MEIKETINAGKEILKQTSALGIGVVFGNVVGWLIPEVSIPIKLCGYVGTFILGCMMADKSDEYIDARADELEQFIVAAKDELNNLSEEG